MKSPLYHNFNLRYINDNEAKSIDNSTRRIAEVSSFFEYWFLTLACHDYVKRRVITLSWVLQSYFVTNLLYFTPYCSSSYCLLLFPTHILHIFYVQWPPKTLLLMKILSLPSQLSSQLRHWQPFLTKPTMSWEEWVRRRSKAWPTTANYPGKPQNSATSRGDSLLRLLSIERGW